MATYGNFIGVVLRWCRQNIETYEGVVSSDDQAKPALLRHTGGAAFLLGRTPLLEALLTLAIFWLGCKRLFANLKHVPLTLHQAFDKRKEASTTSPKLGSHLKFQHSGIAFQNHEETLELTPPAPSTTGAASSAQVIGPVKEPSYLRVEPLMTRRNRGPQSATQRSACGGILLRVQWDERIWRS